MRGENEGSAGIDGPPGWAWPAERRRRPLLDHRRFEGDSEDRGANGLDLEKDDCAPGLVALACGNEHVLPDGNGGVRVGNGGVVGLDVDGRGSRVQVDGYRVTVQFGREVQVAED